jgi:curved DNA-binding protein
MAKRDYYDVLGVSKAATADDIRKAYRKLARQFHPDVNKAADAAKRFNEVQEAYDVLADEQKRRAYDQFGHAGPGFSSAGAATGGRPHYSWSNVGGGVHAPDMDMDDLSSMFEAFFGGQQPGVGGMGGMGGARGGKARRARPQPQPQRESLEHELEITFMTAARGGTEQLRLQQPDGKSRTIEVRIPKGTPDSTRLRVRAGADGPDIILRIKVGPHPIFRRTEQGAGPQGLDLYLDLPLTIAEATLGTSVSVPTLDGSVELKIPPGSASGRKLRVKGQGLEDDKGTRGDLYAVIKIVPPTANLTDKEAELLRAIAAKSPSPRAEWGV